MVCRKRPWPNNGFDGVKSAADRLLQSSQPRSLSTLLPDLGLSSSKLMIMHCSPGSALVTNRGVCRAAPLHCTARHRRHSRVLVYAKDKKTTGNAALDNALEVGSNLVDSAASLVPESVPRGVAKGGVAVAGALIAFWLLQKLVSTVLTIALLGGAAWFYFQYGGSGSSDDGSSSKRAGGGSSKDVDPSDPLAEARRIMDKYKK